MAVSLVVEDGTSKTDSNTYISLADANTYAEARVAVSAWTSASDDQRNRALVQAARIIDRYIYWIGWKTATTQAMEWPRAGIFYEGNGRYYASYDITLAETVYSIDDDTIPREVKDAQCELAIVLLASDTQAISDTAGFKSIAVEGAVDLEIDKKDRIKQVPHHVYLIISHLGRRKGGATIHLMRG